MKEETSMQEENTAGNMGEQTQTEERPGIAISDNMIILLLIAFTLMIGGWWLINLYMGRWI